MLPLCGLSGCAAAASSSAGKPCMQTNMHQMMHYQCHSRCLFQPQCHQSESLSVGMSTCSMNVGKHRLAHYGSVSEHLPLLVEHCPSLAPQQLEPGAAGGSPWMLAAAGGPCLTVPYPGLCHGPFPCSSHPFSPLYFPSDLPMSVAWLYQHQVTFIFCQICTSSAKNRCLTSGSSIRCLSVWLGLASELWWDRTWKAWQQPAVLLLSCQHHCGELTVASVG